MAGVTGGIAHNKGETFWNGVTKDRDGYSPPEKVDFDGRQLELGAEYQVTEDGIEYNILALPLQPGIYPEQIANKIEQQMIENLISPSGDGHLTPKGRLIYSFFDPYMDEFRILRMSKREGSRGEFRRTLELVSNEVSVRAELSQYKGYESHHFANSSRSRFEIDNHPFGTQVYLEQGAMIIKAPFKIKDDDLAETYLLLTTLHEYFAGNTFDPMEFLYPNGIPFEELKREYLKLFMINSSTTRAKVARTAWDMKRINFFLLGDLRVSLETLQTEHQRRLEEERRLVEEESLKKRTLEIIKKALQEFDEKRAVGDIISDAPSEDD